MDIANFLKSLYTESMKKKAYKPEFAIDRELNIHTCAIEEWEASVLHYHRSEPTPYRALDRFLEVYRWPDQPLLVDFGAGLGRINFYFHHKAGIKGYGIELHPERCKQALLNRQHYAARLGLEEVALGIDFLSCQAQDHEPLPESNIFFFFHPFSDHIFAQSLEMIALSLKKHDRTADLVLYYPSYGYFKALDQCGLFTEYQFTDMEWNEDERDAFWVFRHLKADVL